MGHRNYARCQSRARKTNLNGFVYNVSFQLHHKKPGVSPMQREPKTVGGGRKTAQKPASSETLPLCNHTSAAAIIQ
jgi:hypothetical protein